jgi:hypothetical protein
MWFLSITALVWQRRKQGFAELEASSSCSVGARNRTSAAPHAVRSDDIDCSPQRRMLLGYFHVWGPCTELYKVPLGSVWVCTCIIQCMLVWLKPAGAADMIIMMSYSVACFDGACLANLVWRVTYCWCLPGLMYTFRNCTYSTQHMCSTSWLDLLWPNPLATAYRQLASWACSWNCGGAVVHGTVPLMVSGQDTFQNAAVVCMIGCHCWGCPDGDFLAYPKRHDVPNPMTATISVIHTCVRLQCLC